MYLQIHWDVSTNTLRCIYLGIVWVFVKYFFVNIFLWNIFFVQYYGRIFLWFTLVATTSRWHISFHPHSFSVNNHRLVRNCGRKSGRCCLLSNGSAARWCYDIACEFVYFQSKLDHIFREQIHNLVAKLRWPRSFERTNIIIFKREYKYISWTKSRWQGNKNMATTNMIFSTTNFIIFNQTLPEAQRT